MSSFDNIADQAHFVIIKVYTKLGGDLIEYKSWNQLTWPIRIKWDWYFTYRAALLQVKYPKCYVHMAWGPEPPTQKTLIQIKELKAIAKKRKISELKNKLQKDREEWYSLYPIEDDPVYLEKLAIIARKEAELSIQLQEIESLNQYSKTQNS